MIYVVVAVASGLGFCLNLWRLVRLNRWLKANP